MLTLRDAIYAVWLMPDTCNIKLACTLIYVSVLMCNLMQSTVPGRSRDIIIFTKQYNLVLVKGRWRSSAGKVTAGLVESNGSLPPGWLKRSPADWLPGHRDQLRSRPSVTSMGERYCYVFWRLFTPVDDISTKLQSRTELHLRVRHQHVTKRGIRH